MAMVSPTKSGRMVERRDQVLIGRLSLDARAVSTFCTRWWSTNGPFLIERAICPYPLFAVAVAHDHAARALVAAGAFNPSFFSPEGFFVVGRPPPSLPPPPRGGWRGVCAPPPPRA